MIAETELPVYLDELRQQVCRRCPERPQGGPPCSALGKECGVELHLAQLIDAIRQVRSDQIGPYLDHNREEVCAKCAFRGSSGCPCPMDYLSVLVVEAVETVAERREQFEQLRKRLSHQSKGGMSCIAKMCQAYEEATGTCIGCD
jgi:hypothetical protein